MASSSTIVALRRVASMSKTIVPSAAGKRSFHSSGARMGGHGGGSSGEMYSNDYLHAPHMYDLPNMKQKSLKMGLLVFGGLALGTAVPIVACQYQQKKTGGS
ncbi:hypothetical protein MPTK1_1g18980 [Marchantia polymorpha subsp. ruderalis]|uniref:SLL1 protein n=2 Tax=Marchantia polymorpha TaxID=3197 RepID=A0A176VDH5_MARPO|nr:hypothetical protein AXG93_461s1190 [Marchantia polymorpha subsp. ruderalis]PTQ50207.1 hypothetical protein MARPO_0001s0236 [Marchantia polymorpha]BBM99130.1 hypothetical protein Mp_1g18980 [Marchantia polymorpha subsp. ruderalis]|eukprot:PTQ50207.1 hypothetical protein MARPO_0001s0236 [Marchantia polymorpha]